MTGKLYEWNSDALTRECDRLRAANADLRLRAEEAEAIARVLEQRTWEALERAERAERELGYVRNDLAREMLEADDLRTRAEETDLGVLRAAKARLFFQLKLARAEVEWLRTRADLWRARAEQAESLLALAMAWGAENVERWRECQRYNLAAADGVQRIEREAEERGAAWMREHIMRDRCDVAARVAEEASPAEVCAEARAKEGT